MNQDLDARVSDLDFTTVPGVTSRLDTRIRNGLQRGGIMNLGQLCRMTDLPQGLGAWCARVIRHKLKSMGLKASIR